MRKKFLTALLTVTMFTCALMTGCGSENEDEVQQNINETIENNEVDNNVEEDDVVDDDATQDETGEEEFTFADLWNAASDCSENGRLSINPIGQITIFNMKLSTSENYLDAVVENGAKFDMYTVNTALSDDNLQKGRRYNDTRQYMDNPELHDEYWYTIHPDTLVETEYAYAYSVDPNYERVKVEPDPNQPVYTLNARFIDSDNDGVADKIALSYDSDGVTNTIGYIGNVSVNNQGYALGDAGKYMWAFETTVSENGEDFVYYTVLEVPCSVSEDTVNFVIGSPDDMKSKTNVNSSWSN